MSEGLPPIREVLVDESGNVTRIFYRWFEGIQRAVGTPPQVGATGTAQNYDVGTQGPRVTLADGNNVWSGANGFTQQPTSSTGYKVSGKQVVGLQQTAITNASHSAAAPTMAEFNALVDSYNGLLAKLRTHGLIKT